VYFLENKKYDKQLRFELEPYYPRYGRACYTEAPLDTFNREELLQNGELINWLWSVILSNITSRRHIHHGAIYGLQLYPHTRSPNNVLRFDDEPYNCNLFRDLKATINLPTLDYDTLIDNTDLATQATRIIFDHLPLGPFER
jgi:hypothetical protein